MIKPLRVYLLLLLMGLASLYTYTRTEAAIPTNKPLGQFPVKVGDWTMIGQARFDERVLAGLKPTDYLSRTYQNLSGMKISLYIGFHDGGPNSGPIHSPKQCLPGSGWHRLREDVRDTVIDGETASYVRAIYQKDLEKQLFIYWFQVRDKVLTNEYALKFAMARNSLTANRRESSFIRLSLQFSDNDETALAAGEDFMHSISPILKAFLPR